MTKIIGFAGKIGTGKTTQLRFFHGYMMKNLVPHPVDIEKNLIDEYQISHDGKFLIHAKFEDGEGYGEFDVRSRDPEMVNFLAENVWPYVKGFSVADILKEIAVNLFNIPEKNIYGTQEDRLQPTHLRWENMPGVMTPKQFSHFVESIIKPFENAKDCIQLMLLDPSGPNKHGVWRSTIDDYGILVHEPGFMTGRDVLQYLGTEIFRRMYEDVWVSSLLKNIEMFKPNYAIIDDIRFDNERSVIQEKDGFIIYLDRGLQNTGHVSENSITKEKCDIVLNIRGLNIGQSCMLVLKVLENNNIIPQLGSI